MKKISLQFFVFFFFTLNSYVFYSQSKLNQETYYKWFDAVVGVGNTDLYNGIQYNRSFNTINNNHEYFLSSDFINGNIVYSNQPFFNVLLKYDIYNDDLIAQLPSFNSYNIIKLIQEKVSKFTINNHNFVRLSEENTTGFYEIIYEGNNLRVYKKYVKTLKKRLDKDFVYDVFKGKESYLFYYNNKYFQLKSKSSIIKVLPELKKDINSFYKNNNVLKKTNYDMFLEQLSSFLSTKITSN